MRILVLIVFEYSVTYTHTTQIGRQSWYLQIVFALLEEGNSIPCLIQTSPF